MFNQLLISTEESGHKGKGPIKFHSELQATTLIAHSGSEVCLLIIERWSRMVL
jgi:hypothetical protein